MRVLKAPIAQGAWSSVESGSLPELISMYLGEIGIERDLQSQRQRRFTKGPLRGPTFVQVTNADAIPTGKKRNQL